MDSCPQCGTLEVIGYDSCHTWFDGTRWMSCQGCFSAMHIFCGNDDCDWSYDWGLNPRNPRSEENEKDRPDWLDYDYEDSLPKGWVWPSRGGVASHLNSPYWDDCIDRIRDQIIEWREEDANTDNGV
jgi:hypothetical protein